MNNNNEITVLDLYLRALSGLYERMLKFAKCNYQINPNNYETMRQLVSKVYAISEFGFDTETIDNSTNLRKLLQAIEKDFKQLSITYKNLFKHALNAYFENELLSSFPGNSLANPKDNQQLEELKEKSGGRIFAQILAKAVQGDPYYQALLGKSYFLGLGTKVNPRKGLNWIKIAAESGNPEFLLLAGIAEETYHYLQTGLRLNENSLDYYKKAYEKGNIDAAFAIYRYYNNYLSDYASKRESKKWFNRAIEENNIYCRYLNDEEIEETWTSRNTANILEWIKAAADFGEPIAFDILINTYINGNCGLEPNLDIAQDYLNRRGLIH